MFFALSYFLKTWAIQQKVILLNRWNVSKIKELFTFKIYIFLGCSINLWIVASKSVLLYLIPFLDSPFCNINLYYSANIHYLCSWLWVGVKSVPDVVIVYWKSVKHIITMQNIFTKKKTWYDTHLNLNWGIDFLELKSPSPQGSSKI